jgi:hypothetical protein
MQHIFWAMEIIPIFFREYRTFITSLHYDKRNKMKIIA